MRCILNEIYYVSAEARLAQLRESAGRSIQTLTEVCEGGFLTFTSIGTAQNVVINVVLTSADVR